MLRRSPKIAATKFVADKRCTGDESAVVQIVHEGNITCGDLQLDIVIAHHVLFRCFELVICTPCSDREVWMRHYFTRDAVFSKLKSDELARFVADALEYSRRHRRHYTPEAADRAAKYNGVKTVIVDVIPELVQHSAVIRESTATDDQLSLDDRREVYRKSSENNILETLIVPKPECLVPVNLDSALVDESFETFRRSDHQRRLINLGVKNFSNILTTRVQPLVVSDIGISFPLPTTKSGMVPTSTERPSVYRNLRASLRRLSATFLPKPVNSESEPAGAVRTTERIDLSMVRRLSSIFLRQLSFFRAPLGDKFDSVHPPNDTADVVFVSNARFRWISAIDKIITRNVAQRYRQLFLRQMMIRHLGREILCRRSDPAISESDSIQLRESSEQRLPILQLPAGQFAYNETQADLNDIAGRGNNPKIRGRLKAVVAMVRLQRLTIDTTAPSELPGIMSSTPGQSPKRIFRTSPAQSNMTPQQAKHTPHSPTHAPLTPSPSLQRMTSNSNNLAAVSSSPAVSRTLARDSSLHRHASSLLF